MNKNKYLKKKKQKEENLKIIIENLKTDDLLFNEFIDILEKNLFFKSLDNKTITKLLENKDKKEQLINLQNKDIKISIYKNNNDIKIGIDPIKYYNKINNCSIIIDFPMKKRSFSILKNLIEKLFDESSDLHKEWMENSRYSWNGDFADFRRK